MSSSSLQSFLQRPRNSIAVLAALWWLYRLWAAKRRVQYRGRAVLITGCDTGFGRLAAKQFDELGFRVFANCLTHEAAESLRRESSPKLQTLVFDITDQAKVVEAEKIVAAACPEGLWGLINNAGVLFGTFTEFTPLSCYKKCMEVNYFGPVIMTKTFAPLIKLARGRIVNVASMSGQISVPSLGAYTGSKHALEGFCNTVRLELSGFGVKVSIIEPGAFNTNIGAHFLQHIDQLINSDQKLLSEYKTAYGQHFPLGKNHPTPQHPILVVNAMIEALTRVEPKHRYIVGSDARFLISLNYLPSSWSDQFYKYTMLNPNAK